MSYRFLLTILFIGFLSGCLDDKSSNINYSYVADGPYSENLASCTTGSDAEKNCTLATLPFVGQVSASEPTRAQIANHLVVSDAWMGERFLDIYAQLPSEIKQMFGSVTAIVISRDIRPSYYTTQTGSIYIDPSYLWLTNAEKLTISKQEDFRSDFGNDLGFLFVSRYVKNGTTIRAPGSLTDQVERQINSIIIPFARLLIHELAHANDFMPGSELSSINSSDHVYDAIVAVQDKQQSANMVSSNPLNSNTLTSLARVLYFGDNASATQQSFRSAYLGTEFQPDNAAHLYGYSNRYEDFAMLVENVMMKKIYEAELDVAFLNVPAQQNPVCNDYELGWGMRNRAGETQIKARGNVIMPILFPNTNWSDFFDSVESSTLINTTNSWCTYLTQPDATQLSAFSILPNSTELLDMRDALHPHY